VRSALWLSVKAGVAAPPSPWCSRDGGLRHPPLQVLRRDTVSLLLVLPIALPGIVTGLACSRPSTCRRPFSIYTIIIGHATFCIVVVFNNVVARLRRTSMSLVEASADLGATPLQTFRLVTMPMLSTAIVAGGLLAFALSSTR